MLSRVEKFETALAQTIGLVTNLKNIYYLTGFSGGQKRRFSSARIVEFFDRCRYTLIARSSPRF